MKMGSSAVDRSREVGQRSREGPARAYWTPCSPALRLATRQLRLPADQPGRRHRPLPAPKRSRITARLGRSSPLSSRSAGRGGRPLRYRGRGALRESLRQSSARPLLRAPPKPASSTAAPKEPKWALLLRAESDQAHGRAAASPSGLLSHCVSDARGLLFLRMGSLVVSQHHCALAARSRFRMSAPSEGAQLSSGRGVS